jgi:hypothetical protein
MADWQASAVPTGARVNTRGVVFVHSCPRAITAQVEWVLSDVFNTRIQLQWSEQSVSAGSYRAEHPWTGPVGSAARIVSDLHAWGRLRLEVTEEPTPATEGERFAATPSLGIHRATIGAHGDIMVSEERLRAAMTRARISGRPLETELDEILGGAWDQELEPFRYAGENNTVRWLHHVG